MVEYINKDQAIYKFSPNNDAVLSINSGELIEFETRDAFSEQVTSKDQSVDDLDFSRVNAATGPVYVNEAVPGKTLKIDIVDIKLNDVGYQCIVPGFGVLEERFSSPRTKECKVINGKVYVGNHKLDAKPNIGTIGVAPAEEEIETIKPGNHGGNLDTKEIRIGSTLYLPNYVDGGLFALGDIHAIQGDGELCGVAVEIGAKVSVIITVVDFIIPRPVLLTDEKIITLASSETLDDAVILATNDMVNILSKNNFDPEEAYMYLTLCGDLGISQAVNPWKTVKVSVSRNKGFDFDSIMQQ